MTEEIAPRVTANSIAPGIYFGLDERTYHAAPWIGSSNMKTLYSSPPDYWFESHMNPMREADEESFAQKFGTAIHHRILHGEDSFTKAYRYVEGETGDSVSAEALKAWIKEQGGTPAKLKADNERMCVEEMGVNVLSQRVYEKIMLSAAMILRNPHLAQAFTNGFPEVSVFWTDDGVPCKARFDFLKARTIVDLKSFRGKDRIMPLDPMFISDVKRYKYQAQAAHYLNGHKACRDLLAKGLVRVLPGAVAPTDEWMAKAFANDAAFTFVAYKADGMPIARSYQIAPMSPWHVDGLSYVARAMDNYRQNLERFGTLPWVDTQEPYNLEEEDFKWRD